MNGCHFVLNVETPKFIPVADKPLKLGGKIAHIPIKEFQERFGFIYNDGISINIKTKIQPFKENITGSASASQLKRQIEKILKSSNENLVICNMGKLGHGVFALKDIPKNSVAAIYAGTLTLGDKVSSEDDQAAGYYETSMIFSTRNHRGISSLMQHLPEEPRFESAKTFSNVLKSFGQDVSEEQIKLNVELYSAKFDSIKTRASIETENIRKEYLSFNNIPVIALVTTKDIQAGDQLGFNYGFQYWLSRNVTPEFFDKAGNALMHRVYKRTFGHLNFGSFSFTGEYGPLIDTLNQGKTSVIVVGNDKKSHKVSSAKLLRLLLSVNACSVEINPQYKELLPKKVMRSVRGVVPAISIDFT